MSYVDDAFLTSYKTRTPQVVLVGCGDWGKNIGRALKSLGALGGVVDTQFSVGEVSSKKYEVPLMSFEEALEEKDIKGIVLATPLSTHKPLAQRAIQAGKSVFIEKPVVTNVLEFEALLHHAAQQKVCVMGGHLLLYHPVVQELCRQVAGDRIGALRLVTSYRQNFGKFFTHDDVVWDFGPHDFSLICEVLRVQNLSINLGHLDQSVLMRAGTQRDVAAITFKISPECCAYGYLSRVSSIKEQRLCVWGTKGILEFDDTKPWDEKLRLTPLVKSKNDWEFVREESIFITVNPGEPLKAEMNAFLEGIQGADMKQNHANVGQVLGILEKLSLGEGR